MDIEYSGEACPGSTSCYAIDTDGTFLAYSETGTEIVGVSVVYLKNLGAPALSLHTHLQQGAITAICLGHGAIGSSDPLPQKHTATGQALLVVASQDAVVCWQLAAAYAAAADGLPLPEPIQVMSRQAQVDALAISSSTQQMVICAGSEVHVFELSTLRNTHRLEGHHAPVLAVCFCEPHTPHLLITAGEDRTFKVWDLKQGSMVYQSAILTASPLTALAVDPSYPRMAVGASDGVVRFFDLCSLPACRALQAVDVTRQLQKIADRAAAAAASSQAAAADGPIVVSAKGGAKAQWQDVAPEDDDSDAVVVAGGASILRLMYTPLIATSDEGETGLLGEAPKLLVGTTKALAVIDTQTYEVAEAHYLRGGTTDEISIAAYVREKERAVAGTPKAASSEHRRSQFRLLPECSRAAAFAFALEPEQQQSISCCISAAFESLISIFTMVPATNGAGQRGSQPGMSNEVAHQACDDGAPWAAGDSQTAASVFLTQPLPEGSYLRSTSSSWATTGSTDSPKASRTSSSPSTKAGRMSPSSGTAGLSRRSSTGSGTNSSTAAAKKVLSNQPVTFHKKIKSSGYGFVQPQVKMGCAPPARVQVTKAVAVSSVGKHMMQQRQYPVDCGPLVVHQPKNGLPGNAPVHSSAILRVSYSSDASRLLTTSADRTARVMKLPLSKYQGEGTDFIAHNAAVLSACWSHDGTMVLTASADRSARMWNAGFAQPLMQFTHVLQQVNTPAASLLPPLSQPPAAATKVTDSANKPFGNEIKAARFFYMDQFVMLATGSKLHLYRYKLCESSEDDLERLRSNNKYRLLATFSSASQAINDFSCINTFLSPLALLAGSNRSIELVDVSTMQSIVSIEDTHVRAPHAIVQSVSSLFVSHPKEAYELFATASQDNSAKLWDLRSARCVRTFTGHKNSQIATSIAFSPCLRYLASGSEDKAAYIYDLRMGSVLHRIRGVHGDAVMDVAFNPLHPQLATACLDGKLHFYSDAL